MYTHTHICMHKYIMYTCMHTYKCILHTHTHTHTHIYMYTYTYIYIYIYIHIYIHAYLQRSAQTRTHRYVLTSTKVHTHSLSLTRTLTDKKGFLRLHHAFSDNLEMHDVMRSYISDSSVLWFVAALGTYKLMYIYTHRYPDY